MELLNPLCWTRNLFAATESGEEVQCQGCARLLLLEEQEENHFATCSCGACYCHQECQRNHFADHSKKCVGLVEGEEHPLYQYKVFSIHHPECYVTLTLALEWILSCDVENESKNCSKGETFVHWRDVTLQQMDNSASKSSIDVSLHEDVWQEAHRLMTEILSLSSSPKVESDSQESNLSFQQWTRVLCYILRNTITFFVQSPWIQRCKSKDPEDWQAALRQANELWGTGEEEDGEEEEEERHHDTIQLVHLRDDPERYFPPTSIAALVSKTFQHSCIPTHFISFPQAASLQLDKGVRLELRPVSAAEGGSCFPYEASSLLHISQVDVNLEEPERNEFLKQFHAKMNPCTCCRCIFERAEDDERLSADDCFRLLEFYKHQQDFEYAQKVCDMLLKREIPSSCSGKNIASLRLEQARIVGWTGDFMAREMLLKVAIEDFPDHEPITTACEELDAYFRVGWSDDRAYKSSSLYHPIEGLDNRAFIAEAVLDPSECAQAIEQTEEYQKGGWTTSRHYAIPTTDVPVFRVPPVLDWFNRQLEERIYSLLVDQFGIARMSRLRILDAFVVKYEASTGQRRLPLHNDQSEISLTIALNDVSAYGGGGTFFADTGESYTTPVGGVVSFDGSLFHAGNEITAGTRYIIACFLYVEENK